MNTTIGWGQGEIKSEYEDFTNAGPYDVARWVPVRRRVPHLCIRAGFDLFGNGLFVGKVKVPNIGELPAKITSQGKAYVTFDGREIGYDEYDALVTNFSYRVETPYSRLDKLTKYPVKINDGHDYRGIPLPNDLRYGSSAALNLYWVPLQNVRPSVLDRVNAIEGGYNEVFGFRSSRLYIGRTTFAQSLPENQRNVPGRVSLESNTLFIGHHGIEIAISDPKEIQILVYQETNANGTWWPCPIS